MSRLDEARMNRTGFIVALAIAVVAGVAFGLYPELDLRIARYFYVFEDTSHNMFALRIYPPLMLARNVGLWIAAGLLANVLLKDHWGRSRPIDVKQLGGNERFVAWWDPRGDCTANCSFVSGDVAGAFWTIAPAALAPPQWRAIAYGAALAHGTGMAAIRVVAGGHFPSDVIFAGVFTFLIVWTAYALIYRWPRTRLSDDDVDRALERVASPSYDFIVGLFRGG